MIESKIDTVSYDNGEIQRFQVVKGFSWKDLEFVQAPFSKAVFDEFSRIFKAFIITKNPELYGAIVTFHVPEDFGFPFPIDTDLGTLFNRQLVCTSALRRLAGEGKIRRKDNSLAIDDPAAEDFIRRLQDAGWLKVSFGSRKDEVVFLPFGSDPGYLSEINPTPAFCCNSHFFEMDVFDLDSPYDLFGTPFGLIVKDGVVFQPPLYGREALLVDRDGKVRICRPDVRDLEILIQGRVFRNDENCIIYTRPGTRITPRSEGLDVVIVGDEVIALHDGGGIIVPSGGFVLHTEECLRIESTAVIYNGFEDCQFGIQVGSSSVKDGKLNTGFESPFFNIAKDPVPFPPTLYPVDYEKDRAPRMAICSDKEDKPVIVWAEGASKLDYQKGKDSCGASLSELGRYCQSIGLSNVLNMDGGGSAAIFLDGKLSMHVSGRNMDNSDAERPVPMGLMVRFR